MAELLLFITSIYICLTILKHLLGYIVLPVIETPTENYGGLKNLSRVPIPQSDDRLIMWEPARRKIEPIQATCISSSFPKTNTFYLPQHLQSEFDNLNEEKQKTLNQAFICRNGLIVEYNNLVTALLGCNTNVGLLGSEEQSKNSLCYLLKYVTKQNTGITHSAGLILHARRVIEQFPSTAEDTEL